MNMYTDYRFPVNKRFVTDFPLVNNTILYMPAGRPGISLVNDVVPG